MVVRLVVLLLGLVLAWPACAAITVTDDAGHHITLKVPARRIVSLAPNITELLFAAGAGARVVGAVKYSNYPPAARRLPRVGDYTRLDLERIVALHPDLVVAWGSGNPAGQVQRLRALGIKVYVSQLHKLTDIPRALLRFGRLAGTDAVARRAAARFRRRLAHLRTTYSGRSPVRVFYEVWNRPLMTINGKHVISAVIRLCGGRNVFARLPELAPQVDTEAVVAADPQAIVASGMGTARPKWLDAWRRWPSLAAVRAGNLFALPPDLIQRSGPRILEGAARMCRDLQRARERLAHHTRH